MPLRASVLGVHRLSATTYLVREYDEAIEFLTGVLGLTLVEDTDLGEGNRWVVIEGAGGRLVLSRAKTEAAQAAVGHAAGGKVAYFLSTDHFDRQLEHFAAQGVALEAPPRREPYGRVCVFTDLYGNRWDLLEAPPSPRGVVLQHLEALNAHDPDAFFATVDPAVVWRTGTDRYVGREALGELFDDGFWQWRPRMHPLTLAEQGGVVLAELEETLHLDGGAQHFRIAASFEVVDRLIVAARIYREGSADLDLPAAG